MTKIWTRGHRPSFHFTPERSDRHMLSFNPSIQLTNVSTTLCHSDPTTQEEGASLYLKHQNLSCSERNHRRLRGRFEQGYILLLRLKKTLNYISTRCCSSLRGVYRRNFSSLNRSPSKEGMFCILLITEDNRFAYG